MDEEGGSSTSTRSSTNQKCGTWSPHGMTWQVDVLRWDAINERVSEGEGRFPKREPRERRIGVGRMPINHPV